MAKPPERTSKQPNERLPGWRRGYVYPDSVKFCQLLFPDNALLPRTSYRKCIKESPNGKSVMYDRFSERRGMGHE
jgi:hypothetical protein